MAVFGFGCLLLIAGCSPQSGGEPPFSFGSQTAGQVIRDTDFKEMADNNRLVIYEIKYPGVGLSSFGKIEAPRGPLVEEVFPKKWRVLYKYDAPESKQFKIPTAISIFAYSQSTDDYAKLVNEYQLEYLKMSKPEGVNAREMPRSFFFATAETATYKGKNGKMIEVKRLYFDVK